ncbi:accessory gene regulator ArgB-like protein [Desulfolucanica intricata]|uniref:accessory gene regulator ArgB-like protein n=1 Tax=Desulfolucanica intricata TaxID=1285191 RepID=UPI000833B8E7|nr:accessory gene regulator B family protein [Desulfolucanica intricata]
MIHAWSVYLARYLGNELQLNKSKVSIISYGLEVFIGGMLKFIIYVLVTLFLGVFDQFAVALLSSAFLRLLSGGPHCSAYYKCLINTLFIFLSIAITAKHLSTYTLPTQEVLWFSLALAFMVFIRLAPVDVKEKPIRSQNRRMLLKIFSCVMIIIYYIVFSCWRPHQDIIWACSLAVFFHTYTLTQPGQKFIKWLDNLL